VTDPSFPWFLLSKQSIGKAARDCSMNQSRYGGGKDVINWPSVPFQTRRTPSWPPAITIFPSGVAAAE
jgi:hypothetical protein